MMSQTMKLASLTKHTPQNMMYIMKRYQVYLNPHSISVLDEFEEHSSIPRSRLIREAIDRLAQNLAKILNKQKFEPSNTHALDQMIGFIKLDSSQKTTYATKSDREYL
jgi:hypothetical protein